MGLYRYEKTAKEYICFRAIQVYTCPRQMSIGQGEHRMARKQWKCLFLFAKIVHLNRVDFYQPFVDHLFRKFLTGTDLVCQCVPDSPKVSV